MKRWIVTQLCLLVALTAVTGALSSTGFARDLEYKNEEVRVNVTPGEPTEINFPGSVAGGFKKKKSALSLDKRQSDLVVFATDSLPKSGEAIIVRLEDGRSFSVRVMRAAQDQPRDASVKITDKRGALIVADEEELPYKERNFNRAPENSVAGLMREMVLVAEFGKRSVAGYRISDQYRGETVLDDGALRAKIERIFIGSNFWGYVIDTENMLGQTQKVSPASFRLDGTRAISSGRWELSPQPLNVEQQVAGAHKTKVYVITRPQQRTN